METCIKCGADTLVKNGKYKNEQRYKCKACSHTFIQPKVLAINEEENIKIRKALHLYLEGYSLELIGQILNVHKSKVNRWIHKLGPEVIKLRTKPKYQAFVMNLETYVRSQNSKAKDNSEMTFLSIPLLNTPKFYFGSEHIITSSLVSKKTTIEGVQYVPDLF